MIASLIRLCMGNRFLVLTAALLLTVWGVFTTLHMPVDALPDLTDVQVIIRASYPGKAPQLVENQVTYPLTSAMLSVPGAKSVRGYSMFGDSYVYVIFEDGTDLYWARSRVLEYLNQTQDRLPAGVRPSLGPDATGIGWVFEYALVDRGNRHDLAALRSIQDWMLRFELVAVPGVAEVASVGGVVRQYQIVPDPVKMTQYKVPLPALIQAVNASNQEAGGSVLEQAEAEYMIRADGYLRSLEDFNKIVLRASREGIPVYLEDVASVRLGPEMRRGVVDLDGEGEVAGGIVLIRSGENARSVIAAVKEKLESLKAGLPEGVEIVTTYDRSDLIARAVDNLSTSLLEEFLVVALVCALFLMHLRSALVAILSLPLALFLSFIVMYHLGISANIMSLGGIAIAVGAMVDASVVTVENSHRKLKQWESAHNGLMPDASGRWAIITEATLEVGPALFVSLLVITLSFVPVFSLEGQEGRLFAPLALTKFFAMGAAALLSVSVIPVLTGLWVRGRLPSEDRNPLNRLLIRLYTPAISIVLRRPALVLFLALLALLSALWPLSRLGGEFLPRMDEGDLLYMPSTLPGVSVAEIGRILQISDKMIKTLPEVERVFGKAGRAETATDPAPLEMLETTIRLKPREQWRPGMTPEKIVNELDETVRLPGVVNFWVPPIRNRIDMVSTGVKSPIGIRVSGPDTASVEQAAQAVQNVVRRVPGVDSALAESLAGGRYVDVHIRREAAARYGMNIADVQLFISAAVGGEKIGETVEGLARYPINVRYPQMYRDSVSALRNMPLLTPSGQRIALGDVADIKVSAGPSMLKSENARLSGWVYIEARNRDQLSVVRDLDKAIRDSVDIPPGVSVSFTGQFEMLERAAARLQLMIPATLLIIFVLLYLEFKSVSETLLIMLCLPFSLIGGVWFMYAQGYAMSVATGVGFIALAGLAAEFGVIMLIYLKNSVASKPELADRETASTALLDAAIHEGAVLRVRPKAMTVTTTIVGLMPIFWRTGSGSEIMTRIAAPMLGGMLSAALLSMFIIPAAYKLLLSGRYGLKARPYSGRAGL
ncbi:MAG: CusA/CzcA family heavy metal efflux RND transporter [Deltaproteobacteria bacterium]|jgi:Cu(I)/Ag(I) efflux system membrane protein CusA/SilA|nr:CusA/CzcA family heavy metal efflux RND transporter [Deltaproteobacteria bacterium]